MKPDEIFMKDMIEQYYLKTKFTEYSIDEGTDPPDYLITIGKEKIALELTNIYSLFQRDGELINTSECTFPLNDIKNALNNKFSALLNPKYNLILKITVPVINYKKFNAKIHKVIENLLLTDYLVESEGSLLVCDNTILWKKLDNSTSTPRIRFIESFNHLHSSSVDYQLTNMLKKAIQEKNGKMKVIDSSLVSQKWLCLRSDYIIASQHDYSLAFKNLNIQHDFSKILIIDSNDSVFAYDCNHISD